MDQLFLIPASRAPLRRIFLGGKDVLLAYANGKARVWNVETCEFRRSTGLDAGEDMLQSGDWAELYVNPSCQKCSDRPRSSLLEEGGFGAESAISAAVSQLPEASDLGMFE